MGQIFKTIPEMLESRSVEENGASKFYQAIASILPHITLDNFTDTRIVVKHDEIIAMDDLGDVPAEMVEVYEPDAFAHQTLTTPEVIAAFNQDIGASVEQLDSYLFTWQSKAGSSVGIPGLNVGFVFADGITYCFMPQQVGNVGITYTSISGSSMVAGILDGNNLVGDMYTRFAIKSIELQVCGELAQLTPVEVSVDVIEDSGSQS